MLSTTQSTAQIRNVVSDLIRLSVNDTVSMTCVYQKFCDLLLKHSVTAHRTDTEQGQTQNKLYIRKICKRPVVF